MIKNGVIMWTICCSMTLHAANAAAAGQAAAPRTPARADVEAKWTWNLADLYVDEAAWRADLATLDAELVDYRSFKGTFASKAVALANALDQLFVVAKRFNRIRVYAERLNDQDAREAKGQELRQLADQASTRFSTATAFVEPEILAISAKKLSGFLRTKRVSRYAHWIDDITRRRKHIRSPAEEELIARTGDLGRVPEGIYETLTTINMPFPEVTLKNGSRVTVTQAMYTRLRGAANRADRVAVFEAFWATWKQYRDTLAGLLAGVVARDHFDAAARGYESDLAASLDHSNLPTTIYTNMIAQIRSGMPLLWRTLELRRKLLGVDQLAYHDLYASVVPSVEMPFPIDKAREVVLASVAPLGKDYVDIIRRSFDERWIDVYPTAGKRSGAYMSGMAYDVHPYVLLNHNDDYDGLSTLAHELGHAAHSWLANQRQPFFQADYPTFTAEVASTANEDLLRHHLLDQEKDPQRRLFLLGQYLDGWRTTVFRQAIFAEFELRIHELAASGKPLTADLLDATYLELLRAWYGEKAGVCRIDPLYAAEWAYIPHFYYNFYMFQYTTSFIASTAIARKVHSGDTATRDAYLEMLAAGGSKYPIDLLIMAGVDMRTPQPYQTAFASLAEALDEAEKLVAAQAGGKPDGTKAAAKKPAAKKPGGR